MDTPELRNLLAGRRVPYHRGGTRAGDDELPISAEGGVVYRVSAWPVEGLQHGSSRGAPDAGRTVVTRGHDLRAARAEPCVVDRLAGRLGEDLVLPAAADVPEPSCPVSVSNCLPVRASHSRAVPSVPAVTTTESSGLKAASYGTLVPGSWMIVAGVGMVWVASQVSVNPLLPVVRISFPLWLNSTLVIELP